MKKQLIYFFAVLFMLFLSSTISRAQLKVLDCGGGESDIIKQHVTGQIVNGSTRKEALENFKPILLAVQNTYICQKCPIPPPERCEMVINNIISAPSGFQKTDSTYAFRPGDWSYRVKCLYCPVPKKPVASIPDPAEGTVAMCDGAHNFTMLNMPGVVIFNIDGTPMTEWEAQQHWLSMIIYDNGNNIQGSDPWGCMRSHCQEMGLQGCDMVILEDMIEPVSMPVPDDETGGWAFEPREFHLAYFCTHCDEPIEDPVPVGDTENGIIENLYPSPAETGISVVLSMEEGDYHISIVSLEGNVVESYDYYSPISQKTVIELDVSGLNEGMYQLQVIYNGQVSSKQFMIQ